MRRVCPAMILAVSLLSLTAMMGNALIAGIDTTVFVTNPIIGRPTDKSVAIRIVPKKILQIYFEYGANPSVYPNHGEIVTSQANVPLTFMIDNLSPDTRYYYRMRHKENNTTQFQTGDEHTFHTQRSKGTTFKFTIEADPHLYDKKGSHSLMNIALGNQLNDSPDFLVDLGDTFGDDHHLTLTQPEMMQLHLNWLPYIGAVCHSAPFFFCLGNHEGENGFYLLQTPPDNFAVYATLARKYYYANPFADGFYTGNSTKESYGIGNPENYYAWEWGDALFVVLDAYRGYTADEKPRGWDWTFGEAQYRWLKEMLENSNAKYKFVFAHHILGETRGGIGVAKEYEWGGVNQKSVWEFDKMRPGWPLPIHQLMVKNGVNIFFQGHDHLFAKEELDGIVYQEVPMPSDSTYQIGMTENGDSYSGQKFDGSGHLRVTVSPDSVWVAYISAYLPRDEDATHKNGQTRFAYSVKANIPSVIDEKPMPSDFMLEQNYPNPFNPSTLIRYRLKESGFVSLKVYDFSGKEVKTLVNAWQTPGLHETRFDAAGSPSGIYYYQLKAHGTVLSKKAIHFK